MAATPASDRGDVMSALLAASAEPGGLTATDVHDHVITLLMAAVEYRVTLRPAAGLPVILRSRG